MMSSEVLPNSKNARPAFPQGARGFLAGFGYFVWALFLLGTAAFVGSQAGAQSQRAWQAYLINFVFFTGLSFGAVLFVAVLNMTNAVWGRPLKRLAESLGAFVPVSFVSVLGSLFGKGFAIPLDRPSGSWKRDLAQCPLSLCPKRG